MARSFSPLPLVLLALASWLPAQAAREAVVVDQIAAVVNRQPILTSEVRAAAWFARFSTPVQAQSGGTAATEAAPEPLQPAEWAAARQHLIDDVLLQQASRLEGYASQPELLQQAVVAQWSHLQSEAGGADALERRLRADHLTRAQVDAVLRRQLTLLDFLNQHFSAAAMIGPDQLEAETEAYYHDQFVPEAQRRHLAPAPLAAVKTKIAAILLEQERDRLERQWLEELRSEAVILIPAPLRPAGAGGSSRSTLIGAAPSAATPRVPLTRSLDRGPHWPQSRLGVAGAVPLCVPGADCPSGFRSPSGRLCPRCERHDPSDQ